eukprot:scaffold51445_cov38-Cyclotella_meneghiniana.AAC.3
MMKQSNEKDTNEEIDSTNNEIENELYHEGTATENDGCIRIPDKPKPNETIKDEEVELIGIED